MTVFKITYRNIDYLRQPTDLVTKVSAYRFVIEQDWILFRDNDEDETAKFAVCVSDVLSIQDIGDQAVEA